MILYKLKARIDIESTIHSSLVPRPSTPRPFDTEGAWCEGRLTLTITQSILFISHDAFRGGVWAMFLTNGCALPRAHARDKTLHKLSVPYESCYESLSGIVFMYLLQLLE